VAKAALVVGALAVGGVVFRAYPREVELRYDLGAAHRSVTELRLTYVGPEGEMASLTSRHPEGFPEPTFRHSVDLGPGHYAVEATLVGSPENRFVERGFDVPAEGLVRIDLSEANR
tara:strand:- start:2789 stop:3136 length:348 start_codon:yes stop_codon:yes gene_type:complete